MVTPHIDWDPWTPPQTSEKLLAAHRPRLLMVRVLCGILLGIPATCLFPFALWLAVASFRQVLANSSPLSVFVLVIAGAGVAAFFCLWWFVLVGLHQSVLKWLQLTGIAVGVLIMLTVISVQLSQLF